MSEALVLAKLATIEAKLDQLLAGGGAPRGAAPAATNGQRNGGTVASDQDLDSEHGDPTIKFDPKPKYWDGPSYEGYKFSEVQDPAYLDAMAKYLDAYAYAAGKDAKAGKDVEKNEKTARFKALDAARARGHAARLRARAVTAPPANPADADYGGGSSDDDIPFAPPFDLGA